MGTSEHRTCLPTEDRITHTRPLDMTAGTNLTVNLHASVVYEHDIRNGACPCGQRTLGHRQIRSVLGEQSDPFSAASQAIGSLAQLRRPTNQARS